MALSKAPNELQTKYTVDILHCLSRTSIINYLNYVLLLLKKCLKSVWYKNRKLSRLTLELVNETVAEVTNHRAHGHVW